MITTQRGMTGLFFGLTLLALGFISGNGGAAAERRGRGRICGESRENDSSSLSRWIGLGQKCSNNTLL